VDESSEPHVSSLTYRLGTSDFFEFENPADLTFDTQDFKGRISAGVLTLEPKLHFTTEEEARVLADPFVRAWEFDAALCQGRPSFHFEFQGSMIIQGSSGHGSSLSSLNLAVSALTNLQVKILGTRYPDPPIGFTVTPEVEVLFKRLSQYWSGKELLLGMAYSCLSFVERVVSRNSAAKQYNIQIDVLDKLGELTSTRGDERNARKFGTRITPLSGEEVTWIEETIKAVIRHLGTRRPGVILTLADLPPLP
jgi:hypothetical protein